MTNENDLFLAVKSSSEYSAICDETVLDVVRGEIKKYKNKKQALKSAKSLLHQISGAFLADSAIRRTREMIAGWGSEAPLKDDLLKILGMHSSTRERLEFFNEFYEDIFACTGRPGSVIDIACGFNPFVIPFLPEYEKIEYYATDINAKSVSLINGFFAKLSVSGTASASDILYGVPERYSDVVFMFKLLPLLERRKKGASLECVKKLKCKYIAITFPTRSMSNKNVGMDGFYREFMERTFCEYPLIFEKKYKNEIIFILLNIY